MILKSLLRTYFLEFSLTALFQRLGTNFPNDSMLGDRFFGPIEVGMRFSRVIWLEEVDFVGGIEYREVRIEEVDDIVVSITYKDPDLSNPSGYDVDSFCLHNLSFFI